MANYYEKLLHVGIFIAISISQATAAEDNYGTIIGVGAAVLVILIFVWVLLCFCFNCLCWGKKRSQERSKGLPPSQDLWTVQSQQQQQQGFQPWEILQHQSQQENYLDEYGHPASYQEYQHQHQPPPPSQYGASSGIGPVIPKPDYYYDKDGSVDGTSFSYGTTPTSPFKLKPVPPPKPLKNIPPPDY